MISNSAWLGGNFISDFSKILIKWKCISVYHGLLFSFLSCLAVTPSKSYSSNLHFSMQGMQNTLKTVWLCNPLLFETGYFVTCADTDKHAIADHPSVFHAQGRREPEGYPSRLRAQGGTRPTHHRAQPHMHLATPISLRHVFGLEYLEENPEARGERAKGQRQDSNSQTQRCKALTITSYF